MIAIPAGTVCITGCSRGLGRAMALEFARKGWKVAGCARTAEAIATLAEELGNPHIFQAVDVTEDAAMHSFAKTVIDDLGAPNLLVNNAALMNGNALLKDISPEEFRRHSRCKTLEASTTPFAPFCRPWRMLGVESSPTSVPTGAAPPRQR